LLKQEYFAIYQTGVTLEPILRAIIVNLRFQHGRLMTSFTRDNPPCDVITLSSKTGHWLRHIWTTWNINPLQPT